jgi:hypothetical protein
MIGRTGTQALDCLWRTTADNPLLKASHTHEAILPRPLQLWVRERRAAFRQLGIVEVEPWHRPRAQDVRLVETAAGSMITDEWIPDDSTSNIDPRPVRTAWALASFLTLIDAGPLKVQDFVRRFGCLGLTPEGIPVEAIEFGRVSGGPEPVSCYSRYARLAAAALRLAAGFERRTGAAVPLWEEDIDTIRECWRWYDKASSEAEQRIGRGQKAVQAPWLPFDFVMPPAGIATSVMQTVADTVNWWTRTADSRPYLHFGREGWKQRYLTGGLWGALGFQLAAVVTRTIEGVRCTNCGRLLRRERWHRGTPIYCTAKACRRIAWQVQKQRQRA